MPARRASPRTSRRMAKDILVGTINAAKEDAKE
jgi:hypothetical protein